MVKNLSDQNKTFHFTCRLQYSKYFSIFDPVNCIWTAEKTFSPGYPANLPLPLTGSDRPDIRIQEICINFCEQQVLPLSCTISTVEKGLTLESKIQTTVRVFIIQVILFEIDCAIFTQIYMNGFVSS